MPDRLEQIAGDLRAIRDQLQPVASPQTGRVLLQEPVDRAQRGRASTSVNQDGAGAAKDDAEEDSGH